MSFDMEAYKQARVREAENDAREDLAKSVAFMHERMVQLHEKLDSLIELMKPASKKKD